MRRAFFVTALCAAPLAAVGSPAAADCAGPTIEIGQHEIASGEQIMVIGSTWGDNCYDTGAPPQGEGVLGVPIKSIELYILQGDVEWLVATGSADADYAFEVAVAAPIELTPGHAEVQARWRGGIAYSSDPGFVVIDAAAPTVVDTTIVTFGPPSVTSPSETSTVDTSASSGVGTLRSTAMAASLGEQGAEESSATTTARIVVGIAVILIALAAAVSVARSRRD